MGARQLQLGGSDHIRCIVVDDHASFAEAIAKVIDLEEGIDCVGHAGSVRDALTLVVAHSPDVVLMDVDLPDMDGIKGTERVMRSSPETHVVILTAYADFDVMTRAALAGASGFLPKQSGFAEILQAIRAVRNGAMLIDPSTLAGVLKRVAESEGRSSASATLIGELTKREREVLVHMGEGLGSQAIAAKLDIGLNTCRGYQRSLFEKLGVHSQLEALVVAVRKGLLPGLKADQ